MRCILTKQAPLAVATVLTCAVLAACSGSGTGSGPAPAPGASGPGVGAGWTGITNPKDVIHARQELMEHIEELMKPIDTLQVVAVVDTPELHTAAEVVGAMLLSVPHLFPPTTNLYDAKAQQPATLALPPIWENFGNFYSLATAASHAAEEMAAARGKDQLRAASFRLRASCDACHELYLRRYEPPRILDSDYRFDFDSALR